MGGRCLAMASAGTSCAGSHGEVIPPVSCINALIWSVHKIISNINPVRAARK
jgi:hypothetical protein